MKHSNLKIHEDLRSTLERSLELKAVLEHMCVDPHPTGYAQALSRIGRLQRHVKNTKASLGYHESNRAQYALQTFESRQTPAISSPVNRRHQGKRKLLTTLKDANLRILASRAGKRLKDQPPSAAASPDMNMTMKDLAFDKGIMLTQQYTEDTDVDNEGPRGRSGEPLSRTFTLFPMSDAKDNESSVNRTFKTVERTKKSIENFKIKLEMLYELSKIPRSVDRRRSAYNPRKTLHPGSLGPFLQAFTGELSPTKKSLKTSKTPQGSNRQNCFGQLAGSSLTPDVSMRKPASDSTESSRQIMQMQSRRLRPTDIIEIQEDKLSQIIDQMSIDRPQSLRNKLRNVMKESSL